MTELICIICPRGCHLTVEDDLTVSGNFCKRGEIYGKNEVSNPMRVVTSTVRLSGCSVPRLPVKTSVPIPKKQIFDVMTQIDQIDATAPVHRGDVLLPKVLGLDADIVATRTVERSE